MKIHKQYTIGGNKILSFGFITQLISNQSKIALKLKILLLVLGVFIGCQKKNTNTFGSEPENRDPLEKSARLKAGLPWYARYQVGDPVVKGFPEETTEEKRRRLQSWRDAKFGLFIHWGPQAGAAEYKLSKEELDSFNPVDFDAEEWVLMAKRLGFKYMVITPKHHAGFAIYDSKFTTHDIIDATPFKRDPLKELADACAKHEMKLGFYYSVWDIHHPDYSQKIGDPDYHKYHEFMLNQVTELLTNYGTVASLWLDGEWEESWTVERAVELRDLVRKLQPNTVVVNRLGQRRSGDGDYNSPENFMPYIGDQKGPWEGCAIFDGRWFYNGTSDSQSIEWALYNLCYATSRGGNFLMNMGPTPKGQFLQSSVAKLEQVGEWLKINGESIYNTEKGPHYLLEWGTCSRKGNTLYYHIFVWPEDGKLVIPGLKTKIKSAYFLADEKKKQLTIIQNNDQVSIGVPLSAPYQLANVLKVELEGIPEVDNAALVLAKKIEARDAMREVPKGSYFLPAGFATVQGDQLQFFYGTGAGAQRENLQGWVNEKDRAEWKLVVERTGSFNIEVTYGSWMESGEFELSIAGQTFSHNVQKIEIRESLKQWAPLIAQYETVSLGAIKLPQGRHLLSIRPVTITDEAKEFHQGLMKLRDVTLTPNQQ